MKKFLSILLVIAIAAGMTISASAATVNSGISKINEQQFQDALENNAKSGKVLVGSTAVKSMADLANVSVKPGDEIKIPLTANMFLKSDGTPCGSSADSVTAAALRSGKITLRTASGSADVAKITLSSSKSASYISVLFNSTPTTAKRKFNYTAYLYSSGSRKTSTKITIKGTMEAPVIEVDSYDDYSDISGGVVVKPLTNVKKIELYLGNYVSINRGLTKGVKYAGIATADILEKDEPLFNKYGSLEYIYRLQTINLKTTGNIVTFDLDRVYYVYNTNGTYIGTTRQALPYWTKYYLTTKKLDNIQVIK